MVSLLQNFSLSSDARRQQDGSAGRKIDGAGDGADKGRRRNVATDAACCKLFCSEMVGRVANRAVQIDGGAGYMAEYAVDCFYRDMRLFRIYEDTPQFQQLVIARNIIRSVTAT